MTLGTASEEIKKSDDLWKSSDLTALREQQEENFGLWGPRTFKMDSSQGKWRDVTSNSSRVIANKVIGLLASSWVQLFIDVGEDEDKQKRKTISKTEQFANGCISLADRALTSVPSGKSILDSLSFYVPIKGGSAKSVLFTEDEKGKVTPTIRVYDPSYCQWEEGDQELLKFCYRGYVPKNYIERTFKKKLRDGFSYTAPDAQGRVLMYTFFDDNDWKIALPGNEKYIDEGEHGLGYVPINIRTCGSAPFIKSSKYEDTMKYSWMSVFSNDMAIHDLASELLSIMMSKAEESGKVKIAYEWDSSKGDQPEGIAKLGYSESSGRNELMGFDAAKGQKFGGMIQAPDNQVAERMFNIVQQALVISSVDPIAFGQMTRSGSGALAAELRSAALEFINPFRKCIEDDFIWIAEECVRQYKNGKFSKMELEGRDAKKNKFYVDISSKDIEEKRFDCHLVADRLRDETLETGIAIQSVQSGLTSRRTARIKHNLVEDPDREQDIIDEELAARDPVFQYDKLAKYFKDQGTKEGDNYAQYFLALEALTIDKTLKEARDKALLPPALPPAPGQTQGLPPNMNPLTQTARVQAEPVVTQEAEPTPI